MTRKPPVVDVTDDDLKVEKPKTWAAGIPGIVHAMGPAFEEMGVGRSLKGLLAMNQKDGFDCMSCAWEDPPDRKTFEFCENGAKALTWEATPVTVPTSFWSEYSIDDLLTKDEYWLGMQGRLVEPVYKPAGKNHYEPIGWEDAMKLDRESFEGLEKNPYSTPFSCIPYAPPGK